MSFEMHKMIMRFQQGSHYYTEGRSLQVLICDINNERMKDWLIVCPVRTPLRHLGVWMTSLPKLCTGLIADFLLTLSNISSVVCRIMTTSHFRYLRHKIFNEFVRLLCYSHESCSVCNYPLFVLYCLSSSSLWSNTSSVSAPGHEVHTPYTQFSFSMLHTYLPFSPLMNTYYLHHKFHILKNCTHTCDECHKNQIENTTLVFPVVQNILKSLLQYLGVFLWILYRLLWGYTTQSVSVFVLCLHSVSQTVWITVLLLTYGICRMSEKFWYNFGKQWRELNDTW
jgi:hypothetical protein